MIQIWESVCLSIDTAATVTKSLREGRAPIIASPQSSVVHGSGEKALEKGDLESCGEEDGQDRTGTGTGTEYRCRCRYRYVYDKYNFAVWRRLLWSKRFGRQFVEPIHGQCQDGVFCFFSAVVRAHGKGPSFGVGPGSVPIVVLLHGGGGKTSARDGVREEA